MFEVIRTDEFDEWLSELRDGLARQRIYARLLRLERGHFGDASSVGRGVLELRIHHGPGYRVYFTRTGKSIMLILLGGDKSTQATDISRAIRIAENVRREGND